MNQPLKIILDTNTLINSSAGDFSYPSRIIQECIDGKIESIISHPVQKENRLILNRLINDQEHYQQIQSFLENSTMVNPQERIEGVIEDDPEDEKFLSCAVESSADYIVTEDYHLLALESFRDTRIVKPEQFWNIYTDDDQEQSGWTDWMDQIGLK